MDLSSALTHSLTDLILPLACGIRTLYCPLLCPLSGALTVYMLYMVTC